jgi:hypothetical protein
MPQLRHNSAAMPGYSATVGQLNAQPTGCLTAMELTMSDQARVLPDLTQGVTDLAGELARLRAENAKLRQEKSQSGPFGMKVTEKGGVSVYGMGRWPVTLYAGQWEKVLANADRIKAFIEANRDKLSFKE